MSCRAIGQALTGHSELQDHWPGGYRSQRATGPLAGRLQVTVSYSSIGRVVTGHSELQAHWPGRLQVTAYLLGALLVLGCLGGTPGQAHPTGAVAAGALALYAVEAQLPVVLPQTQIWGSQTGPKCTHTHTTHTSKHTHAQTTHTSYTHMRMHASTYTRTQTQMQIRNPIYLQIYTCIPFLGNSNSSHDMY